MTRDGAYVQGWTAVAAVDVASTVICPPMMNRFGLLGPDTLEKFGS